MGKVADILNSKEFAEKTPLEKAEARKDLFLATLEQTPAMKEKYDRADKQGRQEIFDKWAGDVEKKFPKAWSAPGYDFEVSVSGKPEAVRGGKSAVFTRDVEEVLRRIRPFEEREEASEVRARLAELDKKILMEATKNVIRMSRASDPDGMGGLKIGDTHEEAERLKGENKEYQELLAKGRETEKADLEWVGENYSPEWLHAVSPMVRSRRGPEDSAEGAMELFEKPEDFLKGREGELAPGKVRRAASAVGGIGLRVGPVIGAAVATKGKSLGAQSAAMASAGGAGGALAQGWERLMGTRKKFSITELGLDTVLSAIPGLTTTRMAKDLGKAARLGVMAGEGAFMGGAYEGARELLEGESFDWRKVLAAGGIGALFGGGIGSLAEYGPGTLRRIRGEVAGDLESARKAGDAKKVEELTEVQGRIEEQLGIGRKVESAEESGAAILSAEEAERRYRQSPEAAEGLRKQLAGEERSAAEAARKEREVRMRSEDFEKARAEMDAQGRIEEQAAELREGILERQGGGASETRPAAKPERGRRRLDGGPSARIAGDEAELSAQAQRVWDDAGDGARRKAIPHESDGGGNMGGAARSAPVKNRLGIGRRENLTPEQRAVEQRFTDELNGRTDAENDALYDMQPESHKGTVFGADHAKELSADYRGGRRGLNTTVHPAASAYAHNRFLRELDKVKSAGAGDDTVVIFSAGGQGSGKTTVNAKFADRLKAEGKRVLVYDSTLGNLEGAQDLVRKARETGADVIVSYVHNPVDNAMRRNMGRGNREGGNNRYEAAESVGRVHFRSQDAFRKLAAAEENAGVDFRVVDNSVDGAEPRLVENGVDFLNEKANRYGDEISTIERAKRAESETTSGTRDSGKGAGRDSHLGQRSGGRGDGERQAGGGDAGAEAGGVAGTKAAGRVPEAAQAPGSRAGGDETGVGRTETAPGAEGAANRAETGDGGRTLSDNRGSVNPALMLALAKGAGAGAFGGVYGWEQNENAPVEERVARALLYGSGGFVLGAGGGYAAGKQLFRPVAGAGGAAAARLANRAAAAGGAAGDEAALQRWRNRLAPVKPEKKGGSVANVAREKLGNTFAAVDELEKSVEKAGGAVTNTHGVRLSQKMQNTRGMTAKAAQEVHDYAREVVDPLSKKEREALSVLTAVKRAGQRIAQDEADAARAAGMMAMDPAALSKEDAAWLRAWMENPDRRRIAKGVGEYENLDDVNAALRGLRKEIGDEMFDKLDQVAAGPFQQAADRAVRALVEAGVVSEEAYAAMKAANDFYAPYKVIHEAELSHWGDSIPKGGRLPVSDSTIKAMTGMDNPDFHIDDPLGVLAEKIFGARVVAERNTAMRRLADYAAQNGAEDFARPVANGMRAPAGMAKVAYFENGVKRHMAVNERIFNAISGLNGAQANIFLDTVGQFNRVFRAGATGLRLPFATWNLARDQYRFNTMSRYGALRGGQNNAALETARLGMDFTHALYISAFARQARTVGAGAAAGIAVGSMQDADSPWERLGNMAIGGAAGAAAGFGANRAAGAASRALRGRGGALGAAGRNLDAETLYREYAMSGAAGSVLMDKLSNPRSAGAAELGRRAMKPVRGVIGSFGEFAKVLEETTKIESFQRGMRQEGLTGAAAKGLSPAEFQRRFERVVAETRNYGGSPDFDKAGSWLREANYVIPFLNARVQGAGQDIARLAGRDGAKQAALSWGANLTAAGLGAAALWFYLQEPENAKDYESAQRHERMDKYAWVPRTDAEGKPLYFTNERGEKKREAWRIPLSETYGMFTQGIFNALEFLKERDPEALKKLGWAFADYASPVNVSGRDARERVESAIGSMGPGANVPYTFATGREAGLNRDLLPTPQAKAAPGHYWREDTPELYKGAAQIIPQWMVDEESILRSPTVLESVVNQATGGFTSQFVPRKQTPGRDAGTRALERNPFSSRFVASSYNAPDEKTARAADEAVYEGAARQLERRRAAEDADRRLKRAAGNPEEQREILRGLDNDTKDRIRDMRKREKLGKSYDEEKLRTVEERARFIKKRMTGMTVEEQRAFIKEMAAKKILTSDVKKRILELRREGK